MTRMTKQKGHIYTHKTHREKQHIPKQEGDVHLKREEKTIMVMTM
jgi:hypothetical protein